MVVPVSICVIVILIGTVSLFAGVIALLAAAPRMRYSSSTRLDPLELRAAGAIAIGLACIGFAAYGLGHQPFEAVLLFAG
jgi:hypothetical protein